MDIAVIFPKFNLIGGAEKFGIKVIEQWIKRHDVTLYSTLIDKSLLQEYGLDINCKEVKTLVPRSNRFDVFLAFGMPFIEKQIEKHDIYFTNLFPTHLIDKHPNVWCPQEPMRMMYDLYPVVRKRADIGAINKMVMKVYFPILRHIDKRFNHTDKMIANSRFSAKYLESVYMRPVDDIIYPGVDTTGYGKVKLKENFVLSVNRLFYEKRVDLAIKSMEYVSDKNLKLYVVGEGPHKKYLVDLAVRLRLKNRVLFVDNIPEEKLRDMYSRALCTIYTPIREPFGVVPLESMANGTPVVGVTEGGFTEILEDKKTGFLINPTPENIAEKINYLGENRDIAVRMGEDGRRTALSYTWSKTANRLEKLFEESLQEGL